MQFFCTLLVTLFRIQYGSGCYPSGVLKQVFAALVIIGRGIQSITQQVFLTMFNR